MASIVPRRNKAGEILSHRGEVEGRRHMVRQVALRALRRRGLSQLKHAVDEAGQRWPPGRVNIDPTAADELRYRFRRSTIVIATGVALTLGQ
ncbi:hypothetical protein ACFVW5_12155 [Streptomyces sp. NPDC058232]|uniref:hypothetical protein n=1 Tax=unclassified Streptomyces TaxID=2593676 RepID=UPI0036F15D7C